MANKRSADKGSSSSNPNLIRSTAQRLTRPPPPPIGPVQNPPLNMGIPGVTGFTPLTGENPPPFPTVSPSLNGQIVPNTGASPQQSTASTSSHPSRPEAGSFGPVIGGSNTGGEAPPPERPVVPCNVCGNEFPTSRAMYGHLRSHSNRGWRGARPPPAFNAEEEFADTRLLLQQQQQGQGSSSSNSNFFRPTANRETALSPPPPILVQLYPPVMGVPGLTAFTPFTMPPPLPPAYQLLPMYMGSSSSAPYFFRPTAQLLTTPPPPPIMPLQHPPPVMGFPGVTAFTPYTRESSPSLPPANYQMLIEQQRQRDEGSSSSSSHFLRPAAEWATAASYPPPMPMQVSPSDMGVPRVTAFTWRRPSSSPPNDQLLPVFNANENPDPLPSQALVPVSLVSAPVAENEGGEEDEPGDGEEGEDGTGAGGRNLPDLNMTLPKRD